MDFKVWLAKDATKLVKAGEPTKHKQVEAAVRQCKTPVMEPKYNGWRGVVIVGEDGARLFNRSQKEYTRQVPEMMAEFSKLPVGTILDGEIVCMEFDGERWIEDFYHIHTVMRSNETLPSQRARLSFVVFDLIAHPDDQHTATLPLCSRRDMVESMLVEYAPEKVSLTLQVEATHEAHAEFVNLGFEGSVVKCNDAIYAFGKRGHGSFKIKTSVTVDMVIMDLPKNGKGQHLGKVGHMVVGQVRDGELVKRCTVNTPDEGERIAMTNNPEKYIGRCVEIKVYEWSADDNPRHPTFVRWRDDKVPAECDWRNE